MPRYISKDGEWYPAKEKVSLIDHVGTDGRAPGEPYIYEGPDRAALFELFRAGVEKFGINFMHDPELKHRVQSLGFKSVKAYAKAVGYDPEKAKEEFEKKAAVVSKHELPKKVEAIRKLGGGVDTSGGGQDRYGGFGPRPAE